MATTGNVPGTLMAVYIGGTKVGLLLTNSLTINRPTRKTANKDSGIWETSVSGRASWGVSGRALFSFDAGYGYRNLHAAIIAGTAVTARTSTAVSGDYYNEGSILITELGADFADNENSEYSFSGEGTGALAETLITP